MTSPRDDSFKEFVLDQLQGLGEIECRAMFGGYGLYCRRIFFAIIFKDRLYFKTGPGSRKSYVEKGMQPFKPKNVGTASALSGIVSQGPRTTPDGPAPRHVDDTPPRGAAPGVEGLKGV